MTRADVIWLAGDTPAQREIERALEAGLDRTNRLHESAHRTVYRIAPTQSQEPSQHGSSLVLKIHHTGTGRHSLRENLKRLIGRSPARREWRALESLHEKGVPVPRPRAWGRLPDGDEIIASDFLEGELLGDRFRDAPPESRETIVDALARTIQKLHASNYRHGDLHLGNLWAHGNEVYLLDLERARAQRDSSEHLVDLAQLEFSLAKAGWESAVRAALRNQLGLDERFERILRLFLRDHLRGRARRVLRIGRNWSQAEMGPCRGLREHSMKAETLTALVESSERNPDAQTRRGGRIRIAEARANGCQVVVKRVLAGGFRRALGDRLRGSSAARAFHAGQRLELLSDRAARPLAYLEERRFGFPIRSWLVLEKVGQEDLDHLDPGTPAVERRIANALGVWLADAHAWGLSHRDLKGGNIRVTLQPESIRFWLIDLEDLTGPAELSDEARLQALCQLNASLSDEAFGLETRGEALGLYLERAPFAARDQKAIAGEVARRSLARGHRWRGDGCDSAEGEITS